MLQAYHFGCVGYVHQDFVFLVSLEVVIDQVPPRDRPALYAEAGIWQDTLSSLGSLMLQYPNDPDVRESWASLMESADLPEFAQTSLLYIHTDE